MPSPHLLVILHEDDCPPGRLVEAADRAGLALHVVRAHHGDPVPGSLDDAAGLVVMGGGMSADDDAGHPWLPGVRRLLREAVDRETPAFGICLGEQIAALALDGDMTRADLPELGLCPIHLTDAGREDPVLSALLAAPASGSAPAADQSISTDGGLSTTGDGSPGRASAGAEAPLVFQWHQDTVRTLPPDSTLLASGPDGQVQAFRTGQALWAVQFHPEITPAIVTQWARTSTLTPSGVDPEDYGAMVVDAPAVQESWLRMLSAFVDAVVQRRTGVEESTAS